MKNFQKPTYTILSVKQLDADTVEITKRVDKKISAFNNFFGRDQKGFFERVTINRKTQQVDSDRLDINWWYDNRAQAPVIWFLPSPVYILLPQILIQNLK